MIFIQPDAVKARGGWILDDANALPALLLHGEMQPVAQTRAQHFEFADGEVHRSRAGSTSLPKQRGLHPFDETMSKDPDQRAAIPLDGGASTHSWAQLRRVISCRGFDDEDVRPVALFALRMHALDFAVAAPAAERFETET